jgi:20S proteasome subunit alpha 6
MEAVKQGSACVGAKSKTHACIAGIMRTPHEMSSSQPKVFKIDAHMGIAIAGLTADARFLTKVVFLKNKKMFFVLFCFV